MYKVIDISQNQPDGSINFEKIKESGVRGVICRAGYGQYSEQKDKCFDVHMRNASSAGLALGVYWFCYARNTAEAIEEANVCYEIIKDYGLNYPVFYDVEGDTVRYMSNNGITASKELISDIIEAFANRMSELGYNTSVYSNLNFVQNYFDDRIKKYPLWVACYSNDPKLDIKFEVEGFNVIMWQYTSTQGNIEGAPSHLDVNICYVEPEGTTGNNSSDTPTGGVVEDTKYHVGDYVSYNAIYTSSTSENALTPSVCEGTITKVISGARNPYLINDGTGWINDNVINNNGISDTTTDNSETNTSCDTKYHVGDYVYYSSIYTSSSSQEALTPVISEGTITNVIPDARNPYLINNGTGWVNDGVIISNNSSNVSSSNNISVGSKVRFTGSTNYNGVSIVAYFNDDGYDVGEINGDRAVLYYNGSLFDAVNTSDIELIR